MKYRWYQKQVFIVSSVEYVILTELFFFSYSMPKRTDPKICLGTYGEALPHSLFYRKPEYHSKF